MPPRRKQEGRDMFEAVESRVIDGGETIQRGDLVREGHALLSLYPDLFRPASPRFEVPVVEDTSAAPGSRRGE